MPAGDYGLSLEDHQLKMRQHRSSVGKPARREKNCIQSIEDIEKYLGRICTYACCSFECYVLASTYVNRLERSCHHIVTPKNAFTAVLTAVLVAAKFNDDVHFSNREFADMGGISVRQYVYF